MREKRFHFHTVCGTTTPLVVLAACVSRGLSRNQHPLRILSILHYQRMEASIVEKTNFIYQQHPWSLLWYSALNTLCYIRANVNADRAREEHYPPYLLWPIYSCWCYLRCISWGYILPNQGVVAKVR